MEQTHHRSLAASILSLSLLTVMAGAAVAPALGAIQAHFTGADPLLVQLIISVPALFIFLTSFPFPALCRRFDSRTLVLAGLVLYTVGGCVAGCFSRLVPLLCARALVGIGVGLLMPLSTGLLTYHFPPSELERLLGRSSATNQLGGAVATLLAGLLAQVSWRASFLVYALGALSFVLCLVYLPRARIGRPREKGPRRALAPEDRWCIAGILLLMLTFFLYPSNFSIVCGRQGVLSQASVAVVMAGMDLMAFVGGLSFARLYGRLGDRLRWLSGALFLVGYVLLCRPGGWVGCIVGSLCIGFANGEGIPYLLSCASRRAGRDAAATVLPLLSAGLYLGQFLAPLLLSAVRAAGAGGVLLPYQLAAVTAALLLLVSARAR